jgi:hypothetical protein
MVTVCFRCPSCQVHVIRGLVCSDDFLALSRDLPVRLRCPGCGTESFVLRYSSRTSALPAAGEWDSTIGHCLAIAAICRLRGRRDPDCGRPAVLVEDGAAVAGAWRTV